MCVCWLLTVQAATAAAATDRAHARRTIGQAQARLGAALQRLKALAERQQQQSLHLQEVRCGAFGWGGAACTEVVIK